MALHLREFGEKASELATSVKTNLDLAVSARDVSQEILSKHLNAAHRDAEKLHKLIVGDYEDADYSGRRGR